MSKLGEKMPWGVIEIPIGGLFEFHSQKIRRVGDVIEFAMNHEPNDPAQKATIGKAKVTKVIYPHYYEAERIQ